MEGRKDSHFTGRVNKKSDFNSFRLGLMIKIIVMTLFNL